MTPPESLPARAFLLAFDLRRQCLTFRSDLGYLLRAAGLAELLRHGHLVDVSGKARAVHRPKDPSPILAEVWDEIDRSSPRSWQRWVRVEQRKAFALVRDELAAAHVLKLEHRRALGIFPVTKITLRQPHVARRLGEKVGRAIRGDRPAARVDPDIGMLAALAAAARMRMVLSAGDRRRFRSRIDRFGEPIAPILTALRKALTAKRAQTSGG